MTDAPKKKMSKGCIIGLAIIGIVLAITVLTVVYGPGMLKDKIMRDAAALEVKVKSLSPPGYTDEQIHALFTDVMTAFESGSLSPDDIKSATETLVGLSTVDSLTMDEAVKVLEALQMMNPNKALDTEVAPMDSTVGKPDAEGEE